MLSYAFDLSSELQAGCSKRWNNLKKKKCAESCLIRCEVVLVKFSEVVKLFVVK